MSSLLVPVDFSKCSEKALQYAVHIAKNVNTSVTVFHCYHFDDNEYSPFVAYPFVSQSEVKDLESKLHEQINLILAPYYGVKYADGSGEVEIKVIIKQGLLIDDLELMTKSGEYDLVAMGTKGATGAEEVIFGSNAASAIGAVACPIFVVPLDAEVRDIKSILYATDLEGNETQVIDELLDFANFFDANIECLHISSKSTAIEAQAELQLLQETYWFTPMNKIDFKWRENESAEKGIDEYMRENYTDLLVVLRRNRSFLEKLFHRSMSKKLAFHSRIPMLILKEKEE